MKIGNKEVKLYYSNLAARDLNDLCGGIQNIGSLFKREEGQPVDLMKDYKNMISIIRILANANITKENCEIALGMRDGEKQEKFTDEMLESLLDLSHISEYLEEALRCMGLASAFEVPDDLKLEEPDEDLEEINAEKNP